MNQKSAECQEPVAYKCAEVRFPGNTPVSLLDYWVVIIYQMNGDDNRARNSPQQPIYPFG